MISRRKHHVAAVVAGWEDVRKRGGGIEQSARLLLSSTGAALAVGIESRGLWCSMKCPGHRNARKMFDEISTRGWAISSLLMANWRSLLRDLAESELSESGEIGVRSGGSFLLMIEQSRFASLTRNTRSDVLFSE
ncbi:Os06g0297032 [Oryza sativa Japonica Group]|uniref:Os06g0297032 protein n=1 Tax=Oryza sativa subsp. japonica TaxID=39947 RepID=A0A0P0WVV5_ORYSJ|nr:Os06g0297032 [Oryza sativa Japonica Group]